MSYENIPKNAAGTAVLVEQIDDGSAYVSRVFAKEPTVTTTLAIASAPLDRVINVASATGITAGVTLQIDGGTTEKMFFKVISVATLAVTLDRQIDIAHPIGTSVEVEVINMAVTGSAGTPVVFRVAPPSGATWHLGRMIITMSHAAAGDMGTFGGIAAITNGVVIKAKISGFYRTVSNWRTNEDIASDMYDVRFDTRAGGGGTYGTTARWTVTAVADAITLNGSNGDEAYVVVQDNLAGLTRFTVKAQGHEIANI